MTDSRIRIATLQDIPLLVEHHVSLFQSTPDSQIGRIYDAKLQQEIPLGTCVAWIIESEGVNVASGAISMMRLVPVPWDLNLNVAYIHSVYTRPEFRKRGFGKAILAAINDYCDAQGINRQWLIASDMGRPLYEKIGFEQNPRMMQKLKA